MRKLALISLLLLAVVALAACGGGGSGSSGGGSTSGGSAAEENTAASPEAAWAQEITALMNEFENKVSADLTEQIHTSTSRQHLEPLYSTYSTNLSVLANKLEDTEAKGACVAVRKKMVDDVRRVAALTKTLTDQSHLSPEQYAAKAYQQGLKIERLGHHLGGLVAEPKC
ncbi:MAG TPA: hypothetical protein VHA76_05080 [Solirubrobacterales bacterium]|nr:hypothetical protein [Solirubrobacterales bacterium]